MYLKKFLKQYFNSIFKSIFNNNLSFHQKLFIYGLYLSYLLYFITLIGL